MPGTPSPTPQLQLQLPAPKSTTNPPNAPHREGRRRIPFSRLRSIRRLRLEEERTPEWKVLADTGYIRIKFLTWTPEDVSEMDDRQTLTTIWDYYNPCSQAQNFFEDAYFSLMRDAVQARLDAL